MLTGICLLPNVEIRNKARILSALALYSATNLDFEDALLVTTMQDDGTPIIHSYNKHFGKIAGVLRQEP